jgi:7-carboxy-7-deazaguanine synthase (Cx14CxxC type)
MAYVVKEIFYTLQGEGARSGRAAVFCRFAGCNLWSGREGDRARAACYFCDTDFVGTDGVGGGIFRSPEALAEAIVRRWPASHRRPLPHAYVVFTGGEPLLQLDEPLIDACHRWGFEVAVETNGTVPAPIGIDWLTVSPKPKSTLAQRQGSELKLVFPHEVHPEAIEHLAFQHFFLQPMDGPRLQENTRLAVEYCQAHPQWRLSIQLHKAIGIP